MILFDCSANNTPVRMNCSKYFLLPFMSSFSKFVSENKKKIERNKSTLDYTHRAKNIKNQAVSKPISLILSSTLLDCKSNLWLWPQSNTGCGYRQEVATAAKALSGHGCKV